MTLFSSLKFAFEWFPLHAINKPAPVIHQLKIDSKTTRYLGDLEECETSGFLDKFLFYFESWYWKG